MSEFTAELRARVRQTEAALASARSDDDDFLAGVHESELAELRRLAEENGVAIEGSAVDDGADA